MKDFKSIIYLLIGLIIGTVLSVSVIFLINHFSSAKTELKSKDIYEIKENEEIDEYFDRLSTSEDKNTIKKGFIKVVDFLFYDEPINGKRFRDLSESAKLKIIKAALYLDNKIDKYFPDYKESISTTSKNIYTKVKSKAVELYYNISNKLCTNHEDLCETAKEDFQKIKNALKLSWDLIKDIGGDGLESMKKWYESFRESY